MPHVTKPAFEQFRQELTTSGRPMLERNVQPIQAAIVGRLDAIKDLLVEKTRRLPHPDGMVEISAKWFGLGGDQGQVAKRMRNEWPEEEMGALEAKYSVTLSDEAVLILFAGRYEDNRYVTGRMLITF